MRWLTGLALLCSVPAVAQQQALIIDKLSTQPARKKQPAVKDHLLGGAVTLSDYTATLNGLGHAAPGLSIIYQKGLLPHLDFSGRFNGILSPYNKVKPSSVNRAIPELEASVQLKAFVNGRTLNPFLAAGLGAGRYSGSAAPFGALGPGLEVNTGGKVYLMVQAAYRLSFRQSRLDNNLFYSAGLLLNLRSPSSIEKSRPDTDGDGVEDHKDLCPDIAGPPRFKGCPDTDGDGIQDSKDQCPDVPGIARYKGCPPPDKDKDGVSDEEDKCPDVPGLAKYKGCPPPDTDGDGLNDEEDKCPRTKGPASNNGCPLVKQEVKKMLDFAATAIHFDANKAKIRKESYALLDQIVAVLEEYKDHKLFLEGHTDNSGTPARNMELSRERAAAVKKYLTGKGIDESRIDVKWFGDTRPRTGNDTPEQRAQNRRVEMDLRPE